ncbi:MAG: outer membrane beta-barrel protein [Dysgonamonadaceae bacterium]|jgi:hypothetical protein|nr:outer membrane beta-barrel protein [Dysgonamonadaceae bacterium]
MKKLILMAAIALSVASVNAQVFVGGTIGISSTSDDDGTLEIPGHLINGTDYSTSTFLFAPKAGYIINDKLSVGVALQLASNSGQITTAGADFKASETSFGLAPFVRYNALAFGKVNLGFEAQVGFAANSGKVEYPSPTPTTKVSGSEFGFLVRPVLSYDLTDKISLESYLNFATLAFASESSKPEGESKTSSSAFGFGVDAADAFTTGALQIGFVYKF